MMKRIVLTSLCLMFFPMQSHAESLNTTPYFLVGVVGMQADIGGVTSRAPASFVGVGSSLGWISENLAAEFRFGVGGQMATFNGEVNLFSSYLLKPSFDLAQHWDIYGLLGFSTVDVTVAGARSSDTDLSYGLGFKYYIPNESLSLEGEWLQYHKSSSASVSNISGMDISGVSLSLVFEYY